MKRYDAFVIELQSQGLVFWEAYHALGKLRDEYSKGDYANQLQMTLTNAPSIDNIVSMMATVDAIKSLIDAGHGTNIINIL